MITILPIRSLIKSVPPSLEAARYRLVSGPRAM